MADVKFLLVDDIPENLIAMEALLRRDDLEIVPARSASEALEQVMRHDFALALLDVQMPGTDGFELAELMRGVQRSRHVPIIFVTAGSREQQRVFKGYETGAVDFLFKPVDPAILRQKAEVFFQLYRNRQRLEQEIEARERVVRELTETLRLNELFTAALGHDLRNPLGAIVASADLMIMRDLDPKTTAVSKRVLSSAKRMSEMIDQLLDLARARNGGGLPVVREALDLRVLAQKIVSEFQSTVPGRAITIKVEGPCPGSWDGVRLAQLLSNLIGNALEHGGAGGGAVEIALDGCHSDDVLLRVSNPGVIPPEMVPHLFDPFRSGRRQATQQQGLGLGLYIVDQIARAHGGSVTVRSTAQEGTRFEVRLPRAARS